MPSRASPPPMTSAAGGALSSLFAVASSRDAVEGPQHHVQRLARVQPDAFDARELRPAAHAGQERGSQRIERRASTNATTVQATITSSGWAAVAPGLGEAEGRRLGVGAVEAEPADAHELGHRGARRQLDQLADRVRVMPASWAPSGPKEARRMIGMLVSCAASALRVHAAVQ